MTRTRRHETRRQRHFRGVAWGVVVMLVACAPGCAPDAPVASQEPLDILARVGDRVVRVSDFEAEVARRREARLPVPDREALLDELVAVEAMLQRADDLGLAADPAVQHRVSRVLISALKEKELSPQLEDLTVSDEDVRAEYDRNVSAYTRPAMVRVALLHLPVERGASDAKRAEVTARMTEALEKARATPAPGGRGPAAGGFGALAIDYSDDQASRYRGGYIGWMEPNTFAPRWPREVLAAAFALPKGVPSDVITTDAGLYLVMKSDERAAVVTPLTQVESALRQKLQAQKRVALQQAFIDDTVRAVVPEINTELLAGLKQPTSPHEVAGVGSHERPPEL